MLRHVQHRVPVTALAFFGPTTFLSAAGNTLQVYNVTTTKLLLSVPVFQSQAIHGIVVDDASCIAVVWGSSLLRRFYVILNGDTAVRVTLGVLCRTTDWILDAAFSPNGHLVAAVTAHNALAVVTSEKLTPAETYLKPLVPGSNCILYSAHVTWLSSSQCLIASGTAFGDAILWSCSLRQENVAHLEGDVQIHYTFSAHEGSVFGVQIFDAIESGAAGHCKRMLASCSDDRTVRIWDISKLDSTSRASIEPRRDTGFGSKDAVEAYAPPCLAKAMGHASRIWYVRFVRGRRIAHLQDESRNWLSFRVMSFGEDASNITWKLVKSAPTSPSNLPYHLEQVSVQKAHSGKNIWSIAQDDHGHMLTGGAAGAVALYPRYTSPLPACEVGQELLDTSDSFRAYALIDCRTLLSTTDHGKIVIVSLCEHDNTEVRQVSCALSGLRNYSIVASAGSLAFIGGSDGCIYAYDHKHQWFGEIVRSTGKIAGLFAVKHLHGKPLSLLITNVGGQRARLCGIDTERLDRQIDALEISYERELELPAGFITTSFTLVFRAPGCLAILGSRRGAIAVFDLNTDCGSEQVAKPICVLSVHDKETVTALSCQSDEAEVYLHSTGRDGTHAITCLKFFEDETLQFERVHQLALPFGPNVEGVAFTDQQHLWIWGFRSKDFVVYDATTQREIMSVKCAGAHRNWVFRPERQGGIFVWTKASKVYWHIQHELPYELINPGGHGREIKAAAVSSSKPQIIATGAEDTNIKLFVLEESNDFHCLQTLRKHNTGIQRLQWSSNAMYLFSSAGLEEFVVWRIDPGVPGGGIGVVCESTHPRSGTSDLRIMGFDVVESHTGGHEQGSSFKVCMAYSDSTLRTWLYHDKTWTCLASGEYLTACLTHVLRILEESGTDGMLVSTATDGQLTFWCQDATENDCMTWRQRHKVHQSAILSVTSHDIRTGGGVIFTGGDDNAIGINLVKDNALWTLLVPRAHAAAVTALAVVRRSPTRLWLLSASVDQRVKLWQVDNDTSKAGIEGVDVQLLQDVPTAVADVSSLETCRLSNGGLGVVICGVGMDLWEIVDDGRLV